jgi:hypothetical protein
MAVRRKATCLTVLGFILLGSAGCGGGVPTTGESLKQAPDTAARGKDMADGYKKKAAAQKAR